MLQTLSITDGSLISTLIEHLNALCLLKTVKVGRGRRMSAGNGVFAVPGSPRPSCRPRQVKTGLMAFAPSRPFWRNLGRPTVPVRLSDGTVDSTAARYSPHCVVQFSRTALKGSPRSRYIHGGITSIHWSKPVR